MNFEKPNTREVALEGLRQALQARIVQLYSTVTLAGEPDPGPRFKRGFDTAVDAYELAWHAVDKRFKGAA